MNKYKVHTTNYYDTLIEVSDDTKATCGIKPHSKGNRKTIAEIQYELLINSPYKYSSDDIIFQVFAYRNGIEKKNYEKSREAFFSKGQPCLRTSPLAKTFGFGIHSNGGGKIAILGMETAQYKRLLKDPGVKKIKAMRSSKKN